MALQTKSLRAALFRPTAPLSGNEPVSIFRGQNLVLRGQTDSPYFEVFPGNKDLNENYDIGVAPVAQVESAGVLAPAGITGNGLLNITITIRNSTYTILLAVTTATHTNQDLIAAAVRTALNADAYITSLFTVSGATNMVILTDLVAQANDASRNIYIQPALTGGCTGITNGPVSGNVTAGVHTYRLTGTVAFTASSFTVTGTGTNFENELHLGQMILAGTQVLVVRAVTDSTHFECDRAPDTTESGLTAMRMLQMFEINGKRGVALTGHVQQFAKGHKIGVGSGEYFENGQSLAGASMVLSNKAKAAIYRPVTNDFIIQKLGFDNPPPKPVVDVIAGGTKGMVDGNKHSFKIAYWAGSPEGTDGYSDPCDVIKLDGSSAAIAIAGGNNQFRFDFTTSLVGMPPNAKGFVVYASQAGRKTVSIVSGGGATTTTSTNDGNYENGPWFKVLEVLTVDLNSTDQYSFDYLDSDLQNEESGDNNTPPDAEFVAKIEGKPMYISCFGKRTTTEDLGSNPGNMAVVSKFDNPDGAPYDWSASCTGTILGWLEAVGRWFMLTPSNIDFVVPTGLYGQSTQGGRQIELPITRRPYWKTGAKNRYNIIIFDDTLLGFSGNKMFRSIGNGDENVKKYEFGSVVEDITRFWTGGHVLVAQDSKNTQACFVHSAAYKNASGYWVSEILPYSLLNDAWLPKIVLTSTTRDMIVSGVATVDEKFEFLCGGRVAGGTFQIKTYRFGEGDASITSMPYYLIWNVSDDGAENMSKQIHSIRPTGKFTNPKVQVHGARPGGVISVTNMENGTNSLSGDVIFANSTNVTRYLDKPVKFKDLGVYAVRLSGDWNGTGVKDRLEELVLEISSHGRPR